MPYESLIICRHDDGISPTSSPCSLLHSFVQVFVTVTSGKTRKTCKLLCDNYNEIQSDCVKRKRHDIRFYFAWQTLKGRERSTIFFCHHWNPFCSSVNETDADMCSSVKGGEMVREWDIWDVEIVGCIKHIFITPAYNRYYLSRAVLLVSFRHPMNGRECKPFTNGVGQESSTRTWWNCNELRTSWVFTTRSHLLFASLLFPERSLSTDLYS